MTAKEFWESFKEQVVNNKTELEKAWDSRENSSGETEFTKKMKEVISSAITNNNKSLAFYSEEHHVQKEYYRIDLIYWEQKKDNDYYDSEETYSEIPNYRLKKHAWNFDVAVEHENASDDWSDEVIKLSYIFCDLRVVIGYFPYIENEARKKEIQLAHLNNVAKTINTLKCKENMKHGDFMVILGDGKKYSEDGKKTDNFKKLEYTPYIYKYNQEQGIGEFVLLLDEKN